MSSVLKRTPPPLPIDILPDILENLTNDKEALHSAVLVNRDWCRTTTPLLWQNPFSLLKIRRGEDIIQTTKLLVVYFSFFTDEEREILRRQWPVSLPKPLYHQPTFNYLSYLQILDDNFIFDATSSIYKDPSDSEEASMFQEACEKNPDSRYGINLACFKLYNKFTMAARNLSEVFIHSYHANFLNTDYICWTLDNVASRQHNLRRLDFQLGDHLFPDFAKETAYTKGAAKIIESQKCLEEVEFSYVKCGIPLVVDALKTQKTLKKIRFKWCDFRGYQREIRKWSFLDKLEELLFLRCEGLVYEQLRFLDEKMVKDTVTDSSYMITFVGMEADIRK